MLWIALTVRFLLELALLAALGYAVEHTVDGGWRWPATVAVVLVVIGIWGRFLAPKAPRRLGTAGQLVLEAVLFGGAAAALWSVGAGAVGIAGAALWLLDRVVIMALGGLPAVPGSPPGKGHSTPA
jgi:hypothetical protein